MFADMQAEDAIIMALTLSSPAVPLDWHASDDAASHRPVQIRGHQLSDDARVR